MRPVGLAFLMLVICASSATAQTSDPVKAALAQGDLYLSRHKYELAQDAYHQADKAAHHTSPEAYLKLSAVERKLGDFSSALDDSKRALKAAASDKALATEAHLVHANLLVQMSSKPTDKKLKDAEADLREALNLDPAQAVAHFNLGFVLLKQERDAEGIAELHSYLNSPGAKDDTSAEARKMIASPIRAREPFAPDFSFPSAEGQQVSNATLRGKVVLMDFWGTWCPPCRESVPILQNLQKKYANKGFQLVSVSSDDDEDVWKTFIQAQKMNWTEYIDLSGQVLQSFNIESFPTYIVLDKDGVMRFRQSGLGPTTEQEVEDAINRALKRPSDPTLAAIANSVPASGKETATGTRSQGDASSATNSDHLKSDDSEPVTVDAEEDTRQGIERGTLAGNIYKNDALSLTYELPRNWVAAKPEALHRLNEKLEAAAQASVLQQHPEMAGNTHFMTPKIIFYASRRGDGDGQRLSLPCIRITATPSRASSLQLETFQKMADAMMGASGAKLSAPVAEYQVKDHSFLRADIERNMGGQRIWQLYVQALAEDYLLTIEAFALSGDDQQAVVDSLQRLVIQEQ
jgi:thiol-disulfide isomerase/thioredoxin